MVREEFKYKNYIFYIEISETPEGWKGIALNTKRQPIPNTTVNFPRDVTEQAMARGYVENPPQEIAKLIKSTLKLFVKYQQSREYCDEDFERSSEILKPETLDLSSWEEFEERLFEIQKASEATLVDGKKYYKMPLFRGQAYADKWKLKSTLERVDILPQKVEVYHKRIRDIHSEIATLTGKQWWDDKINLSWFPWGRPIASTNPTVEAYDNSVLIEYMAYLRHHSYPSPLLDWTMSPYVAAFFAFRGDEPQKMEENKVSIYIFIERSDEEKSWMDDEGIVFSSGTNMIVHKRHWSQQSVYTICVKTIRKEIYYSSHQDVFLNKRNYQDIFKRYIIPGNEREKVLKKLNLMNINSYSLFGSEDSLMKHLAIKSFVLKTDNI